MKRPTLHLLYLLVLPALSAPSARLRDENVDFGSEPIRRAWIERCRDGDTCRIRTADGLWFNVRLSGIDTPELGKKGRRHEPFAEEARDVTNFLAAKKTLVVRQTDLDRYNRPVVELLGPDGNIINLELVRRGLATAYRGPAGRLDRAPYLAAESEAKADGRGIWRSSSTH